MSKKTNGIQVGNFIVTRDNGSEHDWISIKAVSGFCKGGKTKRVNMWSA
ncbi:hypothetical protein K0G90_09580 [Bacteroides thetaiotaomicron]|uniref:Uncharacterized protein n=1 Tax=Bacteroides thetaiotaomicron TaxID=818 RepID=A0AAW4ZBV5_BACT4|nr:hypothetical protein [Bacteroides thetaiotaomicron]MCE9237518.1 hypothetical protein [Bacteroides thetaiotaomicron]MCE9266719.1 hypothetical protein [Bacteroides thetaiotaomicron]MCE9276258.1 hypothetical protein [Bacteroides thetaiotaomicron]MCE9290294.1 hypothetical protein [Bacteroides thetaiotaomicron]